MNFLQGEGLFLHQYETRNGPRKILMDCFYSESLNRCVEKPVLSLAEGEGAPAPELWQAGQRRFLLSPDGFTSMPRSLSISKRAGSSSLPFRTHVFFHTFRLFNSGCSLRDAILRGLPFESLRPWIDGSSLEETRHKL
jgi:hypothetical protein